MLNLDILYRGPLSSCNYGCDYCPFAKRVETSEELATDRAALTRFLDWAQNRTNDTLGIFFTPWGEALIRAWYQDALARLAALPHIRRAAIQTNLSCRLDWIENIDIAHRPKIALWATWHPEWMERARFVEKVHAAHAAGLRVSAGIVGFPRFLDDAEALRRELPAAVYLWVNAVKGTGRVEYTPEHLSRFERIDPLFPLNNRYHPSRGKSCRAGARVISVDGDGTIRRCHFVRAPIGNLYCAPGVEAALAERPCPNDTCGCHIGYVHLDDLDLYPLFDGGVLERIPALPIWNAAR